jgi:hypothetical protein
VLGVGDTERCRDKRAGAVPNVSGRLLTLVDGVDNQPDKIHQPYQNMVVAEDGYPMLVLESGERILVRYTLRTLLDLLPRAAFVRTHKSYIVRIGAVRRVHRGEMVTLLLRDKTVVPVVRRNREEVLRRLGM